MSSSICKSQRVFPIRAGKGLCGTFYVITFLFSFFTDAVALSKDKLDLSRELPPAYVNYAEQGSYENETWIGEVPEWHYYDMFGNHLLDGFYLYGLSMERNTQGVGESHVALHPFLKKWLNGLLVVGDLFDNGGILVMIGDRVKTHFTPLSLDQSLYTGVRFDMFYKKHFLSLLTSRISNTGIHGMITERSTAVSEADWLHGVHGVTRFVEDIDIGGTYVNIHHEEGKYFSNPFSGVDSDTSVKTPTGLSLYGLDFHLTKPNLKVYSEYKRSQEFLDGDFKPSAGDAVILNTYWDIFDRWRWGGEYYTVGSRFQTSFSCPDHIDGDVFGSGVYMYSLIEDNDDKDDYPENGQSKVPSIPLGDIDGTIPANEDKNKNGLWDYEEDFLSYDTDPPKSKLYFDRNNNGTPDGIEDDPWPDYPYLPSYYLSGERYSRFDDLDQVWAEDTSDGYVSKGLLGYHFYSRYQIFPQIELSLGGIYEKSEEKSYQKVYEDGVEIGEVYDSEKATTLYYLIEYKINIDRDKYITISNFARRIKDNIPNHTQGFSFDLQENATYYTIVDELDYRDSFVDAIVAEFTLFRNRGLNFTTRGKYEYTKNYAHPKYNYPEIAISSITFLNKCQYIYLLPFFKDMFLIPQYKNIYENKDYSPRMPALNSKYRSKNMTNIGNLVYQYNLSKKSAISSGVQLKKFNDFLDNGEDYYQRNFSIQLLLKDRYAGLSLVLTTGFSNYKYVYDESGVSHDPLNNPHRVMDDIYVNNVFVKVHCGF